MSISYEWIDKSKKVNADTGLVDSLHFSLMATDSEKEIKDHAVAALSLGSDVSRDAEYWTEQKLTEKAESLRSEYNWDQTLKEGLEAKLKE